ncbi:MAG: Asp-tRNA(Asn)/Glu-tRNA(Gln) amidotransferase subunit GatB [Dehalococcoidia bacterium]|nr:Asp-tRNA(Asn)/Glu-tRNA(Gln) amidotransferase subunit GatB [Dehalococcoidia bacterium]
MVAAQPEAASTATRTAYEPVIGLEVHVQLKTRSKMFCGCERDYFEAEPNSHVCSVCLGMPGMLPVINEQAVAFTILAGLALGCDIPAHSKFDRKNYPYPDLVKGYQISQYDQPLCLGGTLEIEADGVTRSVQIERIHLEEDTARLLHREGANGDSYSLIDVNRSGVPLMELVTRPDMHSAAEAMAFLRTLRQVLRYVGVSDADMEKGSFRCDANVSLRPVGTTTLGNKVEVKNMNSFRAVGRALEFEIERQARVLSEGGRVAQETRGYIDATGATVSQRSKEEAHDYRYFPEPDLPPLETSRVTVEELRGHLPELPAAKRERFVAQYGLTPDEARQLVETRAGAEAFEQTVALAGPAHARDVAHWLIGDVTRLLGTLGEPDAELTDSKLTPAHIAELVGLVGQRAITAATAKEVLQAAFESGEMPAAIVDARGLRQINDDAEIDRVAAEVIDANPQAVADYRGGKEAAVKFLVGQVMRAMRGRADPNGAAEALLRRLQS